MENEFYIYALFRPWDMTPCYVGKGKGNRYRVHGYKGRCANRRLASIIKKADGPLPTIKIRQSKLGKKRDAVTIEKMRASARTQMANPAMKEAVARANRARIWTSEMRAAHGRRMSQIAKQKARSR